MKLPYRVIWVDDRQDWVDSIIEDIKEYLDEEGYVLELTPMENGDELDIRLSEADMDLIIIDYTLPGNNGDMLISNIRDTGSFTEIVFYSQEGNLDTILGTANGVFRCHRDAAVETIKKVIQLTLHKTRDLSIVRGLVIALSIDIEVKLEQLIILIYGDKGELFRERILEKHWLDFGKKAAFLSGVIKDRISEIEEGETKEQLKTVKTLLNEFEKEVIETRNILAHSRTTTKDGEIVLEGINKRSGIKFNSEWLSELRATLRKHQNNLDTLEKLLS